MVPLNHSGTQVREFHLNVPVEKVLGITRDEYIGNWQMYAAFTSANPPTPIYLDVIALTATTNETTVLATVLLEFDVEFSGNTTPSQS